METSPRASDTTCLSSPTVWLRTPKDDNILQGVSRQVVFELAEGLGIPALEEDLQPYDLYTADEVFFSRTSPRIVPVAKCRHPAYRQTRCSGTITRQLLAAHSELVGVDIVGQSLHYAGVQG